MTWRDLFENPSKTWLFSYGSNGPRQLEERLGHVVEATPAYTENHKRVYRGFSRTWGGAPASLIARQGSTTYGNIIQVSAGDLDMLDRYEGVHSGNYRRKKIQVYAPNKLTAVTYVSTSNKPGQPTAAYLQAVADNVGSFWTSGGRSLRALDFAP